MKLTVGIGMYLGIILGGILVFDKFFFNVSLIALET